MIDCRAYFELLARNGIDFFTGVPDSLLKDFSNCVSEHATSGDELITANEGAAVALAAGHHLATGGLGLVYMQNSGLGNAMNPLTSLVDPEVYSIPILLLIGWRGEPGHPDEPQHLKQGRVTLATLETLEIPYEIHPETLDESAASLERAVEHMRGNASPYALVVRAGTFSPYEKSESAREAFEMRREEAVIEIASLLDPADVIVSTTGKTSRELFEYRASTSRDFSGDFLTVGSMGHASQIAMGVALARPSRQVVCLDGDGAAIMHMGSMAISGRRAPENFKHVIVNNAAHDSVGGQPTVGNEIDFPAIARACGYRDAWCVSRRETLKDAVGRMRAASGPVLLEVRVSKGARTDLGRPTIAPIDNKHSFMKRLVE
ncbi:MAG: phosphonopyruvate decarboxylase [bacterium]|nr:phosphonopyruvate decarboxylase [bacterium]